MRLFVAFSAFCLAATLAACSRPTDVPQVPSEPLGGAAISSIGPKIAPDTRFTLLYRFDGTIGAHPVAPLIVFRGLLYGTTVTGAGCCGGVFSVDPNLDVAKNVYSFSHHDGASPTAGLTVLKDRFYGTTTTGGLHTHFGTVFELDPATGVERVLHSFADGADGRRPESGLFAANGLLYGTTLDGGTSNMGTVFVVNPATGAEQILHSFGGGADGAHPKAGVILVNGRLFGTTYEGGDCCGTIFELNPTTKSKRVAFKFDGSARGGFPRGDLIALNGRLYGTTERAGNASGVPAGNVYEFDSATGAERSLYNFDFTGSAHPYAGLTVMAGKLYGTTYRGGNLAACAGSGCGTVFELSLDGTERALVSFSGGDGQGPEAGLIALNNRLYGTTASGGSGGGTVFEVLP